MTILRIEQSRLLAKDMCEALKIPFDGIRNIEIECKYDDVPILRLEKIITIEEAHQIAVVLEKYEIARKIE